MVCGSHPVACTRSSRLAPCSRRSSWITSARFDPSRGERTAAARGLACAEFIPMGSSGAACSVSASSPIAASPARVSLRPTGWSRSSRRKAGSLDLTPTSSTRPWERSLPTAVFTALAFSVSRNGDEQIVALCSSREQNELRIGELEVGHSRSFPVRDGMGAVTAPSPGSPEGERGGSTDGPRKSMNSLDAVARVAAPSGSADPRVQGVTD